MMYIRTYVQYFLKCTYVLMAGVKEMFDNLIIVRYNYGLVTYAVIMISLRDGNNFFDSYMHPLNFG